MNVATENTVAVVTVSKAGGNKVNADGSLSTGNTAIVEYAFFPGGDGLQDIGAVPVPPQHTYAGPGTYSVTLRVKDTLNRVGFATVSVTVP